MCAKIIQINNFNAIVLGLVGSHTREGGVAELSPNITLEEGVGKNFM